jgi:hypothetical protein
MHKVNVLPTIEEEEEPPVVGFARATRLTDAFVHRLRLVCDWDQETGLAFPS